jgi:thiol-disulfide isomerase/thioredoxin
MKSCLPLTVLSIVLLINAAFVPSPLAAQNTPDPLASVVQAARVKKQPMLLVFHAPWCAPCRQLLSQFDEQPLATELNSVVFTKIDISDPVNEPLTLRYQVTSIPTMLLVDTNGLRVAANTGSITTAAMVEWLTKHRDAIKSTDVAVLLEEAVPTRTEMQDLIGLLADRNPVRRELAWERLSRFPKAVSPAAIAGLSDKPLAVRIQLIELLSSWQAPIEDLDPWIPESLTDEKLAALNEWATKVASTLPPRPLHRELSADELRAAVDELDRFALSNEELLVGLSRLVRYGSGLLPSVYQRIATAQSDNEVVRLTSLRYWLVASHERKLGWGALLALASMDLEARRAAMKELIPLVTKSDEALLLELFSDPDPLIRELSLNGLSGIGAAQTDEALARLLDDPDPNVRAAVLKQLSQTPSPGMVVRISEYLAREQDSDLIVHGLGCLKESTSPQAIAALVRLAEHDAWQVRARVAELLKEIDADEVPIETSAQIGTTVMALLNDEDGFVVSRAVAALPPMRDSKTLDQLKAVLMRHPHIAEPLLESLTANIHYSSGEPGGNIKLVAFFESLLTEESDAVRALAINGLAKVDSKLATKHFSGFLADKSPAVRKATLAAMKQGILKTRETVTEQLNIGVSLAVPRAATSNGKSLGEQVLSIFGLASPTRPESPAELSADEQVIDEVADEAPAAPLEPSDQNEPVAANNDPPQLDANPPLVEEAWLNKWLTDPKARPAWLLDCAEILQQLTSDPDESIQIDSLYLLAASGQHDKALVTLMAMAEKIPAAFNTCGELLRWLPLDLRCRTFEQLLTFDHDKTRLVDEFTTVRNPLVAEVIWNHVESERLSPSSVQRGLLQAYLGQRAGYYGVNLDEISPRLVSQLAKIVEHKTSTGSEARRGLGLALSTALQPNLASKRAIEIFHSTPPGKLRDLALDVVLSGMTPQDRNAAAELLDGADAATAVKILRHLAIGSQSPYYRMSEAADWYYVIPSYSRMVYSLSGDERKHPKAPATLTLEQLRQLEESPDLENDARALAEYYRVLLGERSDLANLRAWSLQLKNDAGVDRLLYQTISLLNEVKFVGELERIYEGHKEDITFCSSMYWSIRLMKGPEILKLRKRMRDELGVQNLMRS